MTLSKIIKHLLENETDRLHLANAFSGNYSDDLTWDDILKEALNELKKTPAGMGKK